MKNNKKMNALKDIIIALRDNPSAAVLALCLCGLAYMYTDFRDYITKQNEIQAVLNERFISSLERINERLNHIEVKINK